MSATRHYPTVRLNFIRRRATTRRTDSTERMSRRSILVETSGRLRSNLHVGSVVGSIGPTDHYQRTTSGKQNIFSRDCLRRDARSDNRHDKTVSWSCLSNGFSDKCGGHDLNVFKTQFTYLKLEVRISTS